MLVDLDYFPNDPLNYRSSIIVNHGYQCLIAAERVQAEIKNIQFSFLLLQSGFKFFIFLLFFIFFYYFIFIFYFFYFKYFSFERNDTVVDVEGAKLFYKNAASKDKQLEIFEGAYHGILDETEEFGGKKAKLLAIDWMKKRI